MARRIKRAMDVFVAAASLVLAAPLMMLVAVVVRASSRGPAIFTQRRVGKRGRPFSIHKFRTMVETRNPGGQLLPDSERLTSVGRWLRRSSIDELPQLWDVLVGELSLVGPRPLPLHYYSSLTERETLRHAVEPGITGWAQIRGRNEASWDQRLADDVWYVENWSLRLDLFILWKTLLMVATGRGVVVDPHSAMKDLDEERASRMPAR